MARVPKSPDRELSQFADNSTKAYRRIMLDLAKSIARGDEGARNASIEALSTQIGQSMALADLFGRRRLFMERDFAEKTARAVDAPQFLFAQTPLVPNVEFEEALRDIITREPRIGFNTGEAVAELYQTRHAFALARSADQFLTNKIQDLILKSGLGAFPGDIIEEITRLGLDRNIQNFTAAYAETVYRTNLNTAYTAGRFRQAADPEVAEVIGALEYVTAGDEDVRENHQQADGLIAGVNDPVWRKIAPPVGYNCRCTVLFVNRAELEDRGLLLPDGRVRRFEPPGFDADTVADSPRFGRGRPDINIYSGGSII